MELELQSGKPTLTDEEHAAILRELWEIEDDVALASLNPGVSEFDGPVFDTLEFEGFDHTQDPRERSFKPWLEWCSLSAAPCQPSLRDRHFPTAEFHGRQIVS
ncbi:unnamed protein product [Calypogeia fissa]